MNLTRNQKIVFIIFMFLTSIVALQLSGHTQTHTTTQTDTQRHTNIYLRKVYLHNKVSIRVVNLRGLILISGFTLVVMICSLNQIVPLTKDIYLQSHTANFRFILNNGPKADFSQAWYEKLSFQKTLILEAFMLSGFHCNQHIHSSIHKRNYLF